MSLFNIEYSNSGYIFDIKCLDMGKINQLIDNFEIEPYDIINIISDIPLNKLNANDIIFAIFELIIQENNLKEEECYYHINCTDSCFYLIDNEGYKKEVHYLEEIKDFKRNNK